ncbi:MAG: HD domain-containing protein [Brevinematales bacterium]|nr:HD domain-containing protein [Brevinematales bacterium]
MVEKITYYLLVALLSGTIIYFLGSILTFIGIKTKRIKSILTNISIASIAYGGGSFLIYLFRNHDIAFVIAGSIYILKFLTETDMANKTLYSQKNYKPYYLTTIVILLFLFMMIITRIGNNSIYSTVLVMINTIIGTGWFLDKNFRILSLTNIVSILFLVFLREYPATSLLFSLIPYGMNSIYITSKDYIQTLRSLEILTNKRETIVEHQIRQFKEFLFLLIKKIEGRYSFRKMHSFNVSTISEGIARELGLEEKVVNLIKDASMIHDIGFIGIDHRKLTKGSDYEKEAEIIKHISVGRKIIENSNIFIKYLPIVLYHHEKVDSSGPERLSGNMIPLPVRIVAVADKFERMINGRESKKFSIKEALEFLQKNTNLYDQVVVKALERYVLKNFNY